MGESQRLLWVIVSVALLVVVVLAGGLYWLRPAAADEQVAAAGVPAFDPYEFVRGDQPAPGLLPKCGGTCGAHALLCAREEELRT